MGNPLKFPISARHCSVLNVFIPKYEQPSYMNQYNDESKSDDYSRRSVGYKFMLS